MKIEITGRDLYPNISWIQVFFFFFGRIAGIQVTHTYPHPNSNKRPKPEPEPN